MIGEICALAGAVVWALNSILIRSQTGKIDALSLNALQYLTASIFFVAILFPLGKASEILVISLLWMVGLVGSALLSMAGGDTFYIRSLGLIGVPRAFPVAMCSYPLMASIVAISLLGEVFTWGFGVGATMVLLGMYLVAVPRATSETKPIASIKKGIILAFLAAICWATAVSVLKLILKDVDVIAAASVRVPAAALLLTGLAWRRGNLRLRSYGWRSLAIVALAGILGIFLGTIFFQYAIQLAGAARAAILAATSPLFALPLSAFLLKERPTARMILGTLLSVAGIALIVS